MTSFFKKRTGLVLTLVFTIALFVGLQYFSRGHFADPDGFYHARASQLLSAGRLGDTFPWMYFTTWNESYANQHYLYHWLLTPFNTLEKLPLSIVLFGAVFIISFTWVLLRFRVLFTPFWLMILLGSSVDFLFRINIVKANTISLAMICMIIVLVHIWHFSRNKSALWGIGLISGIFVWTYGGFICVPLLLGAYFAANLIKFRNLELKQLFAAALPFIFSIVGISLGIVLHPQSHNLISLLYDQIFQTGLGAGSVVPAGNEWLPFNISWFIESNILILFLWLFSFATFLYNVFKSRIACKEFTLTFWLQITAIGLMALTLWHRRFVEYWIPFAVLASAITLQPYLQKITWEESKQAFSFWQIKFATALITFFILFISVQNIHTVSTSLQSGDSVTAYQAAAQWLEHNSEPEDIVVNTQWDQFPQLFYNNSKNYYVVGLDPTFMYLNDPNLYWKWRIIADDDPKQWQSLNQIHEIITKDLQAKFIFIDTVRNPDIYEFIIAKDLTEDYFEIPFLENNKAIVQVK